MKFRLIAAAFQYFAIPTVRAGMQFVSEGAALPAISQYAIDFGKFLYAVPFLVIILQLAARRFPVVASPQSVSIFGALLSSFYLLYGIALALPWIAAAPCCG